MKSKTVTVLVAAAVGLGIAAYLVDRAGRPASESKSASSGPLFEGLSGKVNEVATVVLKKGTTETTVQLKDGAWVMADKGGYPVQVEQVKGAIVGLSELRKVEAKTSRPENYAKIGVQDPGTEVPKPPEPEPADPMAPPPSTPPATQPTQLTLKDAQGNVLASAIIGTQKYGTPPEVFVRKAGEAQSWLAQGRMELPNDPMGWVERQILNIGRERIKSATITHPDGTRTAVLKSSKDEKTFTVLDVPEGRELSGPTAGDTLGSAPSYVNLDDVATVEQFNFADEANRPTVAEFRTFDGLVITTQTLKKDDKYWCKFDVTVDESSLPAPPAPPPTPAATDPATPPDTTTPPAPPPTPPVPEGKTADDIRKEATDLQAKLGKWAFALPEYKAKYFMSKIDDMLKAPPAPPTPPAEAPAPLDTGPAGPVPTPAAVPTAPTPAGPAPAPPSALPTPPPSPSAPPAPAPAPAPAPSPQPPPAEEPATPPKEPEQPPPGL
jgi:hypothetical protein